MKRTKLLLLTLLAVVGWNTAQAETVSTYEVDFNTAIPTSNHDFAVATNWKHIVGIYEDLWDNGYMSYSYSSSEGIGGTGTLLAYRQYAQNMYNEGAVCYDLLVTPKVSGTVTMYVKASSSATNSYPAMVEIYDVDDAGTTRGELIKKFTVDNGFVPDENNAGWCTITLSVDTEKRLGIRAQYVYLDNFSATSASIVTEKKLTINRVADVNNASTTYFDQQEDGTILARYLVTLTNSGDVNLNVGDENYTLSLFNRSEPATLYGEFLIPVALAVGETSEPFEMQVSLPSEQYGWKYWDVKENISGTTKQGKWCGTNLYEPKFVFREGGSTSTGNLYGDIAFGKITVETTKTYEIYNDGVAPLQVKSITAPEGFVVNNSGNFTLESKANQPITITLPVTTPGIFSGNLEIVYVDKTGADVTYTKAVTGTVLDPSKNLITFDDGAGNKAFPQGSVRYDVYITNETSGGVTNYYLQASSNSNKLFVTPLMTATEGESLAFDAKGSGKVEVMISTDRQNWTTIQTINSIASNWTTYTATIPDAGDYYIGFMLNNSNGTIDNIYGLVTATAPEHDLLLVKSNIPATGKQNNDYTATASIGNVGPNVETAGSYTATLYVDGEAVATSNEVDLPVAVISGNYNNGEEENYTTLSFTFRPHIIGEKPVYIEVKSGDAVVTTEVVNVDFAEEKVESEVAISGENYSNGSLLHLNWNNSESITLYTAEMLANAGLKVGDKIESITYKGYCSNSTAYSTQLSVWYEKTTDDSQTQPNAGKYDTSGMTQVLSETHTWTPDGSSSEWVDLITINLAEPIVYDGNALRFVVCSEGTTYKSGTYFEVTSTGGNGKSYYNRNDTYNTFANSQTWSQNSYVPAIHFGLKAEAKTLSGVVTDENGNPLEGATVTIRNAENDIEYFATTDEEGAYTINVVQDKLTYTVTVTADGYETLVDDDELDFTEASLIENFALTSNSVEIAINSTEYATFYYSNSAYIIPEGVEVKYVESVKGNKLTLLQINDIIPAGCAVILEGPQGTYTFKSTSKEGVAVENLLRGFDVPHLTEGGDIYYKLTVKNGKVGFYWGEENGEAFENAAHKAYLALPADEYNGVNFFTFDNDNGNATGIDNATGNIETDTQEVDRVYNLSGQRVNDSYKGITIVNGKKVMRK